MRRGSGRTYPFLSTGGEYSERGPGALRASKKGSPSPALSDRIPAVDSHAQEMIPVACGGASFWAPFLRHDPSFFGVLKSVGGTSPPVRHVGTFGGPSEFKTHFPVRGIIPQSSRRGLGREEAPGVMRAPGKPVAPDGSLRRSPTRSVPETAVVPRLSTRKRDDSPGRGPRRRFVVRPGSAPPARGLGDRSPTYGPIA